MRAGLQGALHLLYKILYNTIQYSNPCLFYILELKFCFAYGAVCVKHYAMQMGMF